jgi:hypothetical protein
MKLTRRSTVFNWPAELQMGEDQTLWNIKLLRILVEDCSRHPAYRARRAATGNCDEWVVVWKARHELNDKNL